MRLHLAFYIAKIGCVCRREVQVCKWAWGSLADLGVAEVAARLWVGAHGAEGVSAAHGGRLSWAGRVGVLQQPPDLALAHPRSRPALAHSNI